MKFRKKTKTTSVNQKVINAAKIADNYVASHPTEIYPANIKPFQAKITSQFDVARIILEQASALTLGEFHDEQTIKYIIDNLAYFKALGVTAIIVEGLLASHQDLLNQYFQNSDYRKIPAELYFYIRKLDEDWKYYSAGKFHPYSTLGLVVLAKQLGVKIIAVENANSLASEPGLERTKIFDYLCMPRIKKIIEAGGKLLIRTGIDHLLGIAKLGHTASIIVRDKNVPPLPSSEENYPPADAIIYVDPTQKSAVAIKLEEDCNQLFEDYEDYSPIFISPLVVFSVTNLAHRLFAEIHKGDNVTVFKKEFKAANIATKKNKRGSVNNICVQSNTLLHEAISRGRYQIANYLLTETDVDINCKDNNDDTILHQILEQQMSNSSSLDLETIKKMTETVRLIVTNKNFNLNANNQDGESPLHIIVRTGNMNILNLFIAVHLPTSNQKMSSIDFNCQNSDKETPLYLAVKFRRLEILKFFLQHATALKLNINARNTNLITPLHLATINQETDITELLVNNGANINAKDIKGCTPLHWAIYTGNINQLNFLLTLKNIDINCQTIDGQTPLHLAIYHQQIATMKLLVENGTNINVKDNKNRTPLHEAVLTGDIESVKFLLTFAYIEINIEDCNNKTALHYAQDLKQEAMVQLLKSHEKSFKIRYPASPTLFAHGKQPGLVKEEILFENPDNQSSSPKNIDISLQ